MSRVQLPFVDRILRRPRSLAVRNWIFQIHLYAGLLVALYAIVIGISGSAVVFRPEMRDFRERNLRWVDASGTRAPPDRILEAIHAAHPGVLISQMYFPQKESDTYRVSIGNAWNAAQVYVNPFTAEIVGEQRALAPGTRDWISTLQSLHFDLLSGRTGRIVNGVFGLIVVVLCLTGIVIWWPGTTYWVRALLINWRGRWQRVNYDLHSSVGACFVLFILLMSLTGAYYAWPVESRAFISRFSPARFLDPAPLLPPEPADSEAPLSRLIAVAEPLVPPDAKILRVTYIFLGAQERPRSELGSKRAVQLVFSTKGQYDDPYLSSVFLDPRNADVMRIDRADQRSFGDSLAAWIPTLHFGTFGGIPIKIIWLLLGLAPSILGVTGFLMWWNRVARRRVRGWIGAVDSGRTRTTKADT
jgi:uncharacterized iron-regulated membrane protein